MEQVLAIEGRWVLEGSVFRLMVGIFYVFSSIEKGTCKSIETIRRLEVPFN